MIISERIFYVMEQKNITQLELSRRTGIATSNISDWKKKKTNPKADCLLSICDALDITPEQLLTGKGIDPEYKDADMDYEVTRSVKISPLPITGIVFISSFSALIISQSALPA